MLNEDTPDNLNAESVRAPLRPGFRLVREELGPEFTIKLMDTAFEEFKKGLPPEQEYL